MGRTTTRNSEGIAVLKVPYQCDRCGEEVYRLGDCGNGEPIEKLARYEDLEEQGKLRELPCRPGDYALLSNGSIVPVIYVTYTEDDIEIGCQNGIHVSMGGRSAYRCSGFSRTRREAQEAQERMGNEKA